MASNLPATRSETALVEADEATPLPRQPRVGVAFLPFALVTFIIIAFTMAAWTFLSTAV